MLRGEVIELRLVEEGDLRQLYELMSDLSTRGAYFPLGVMSEPALRAAFAKNGFWDDDEGMLVMVKDNTTVGEIEFFPITHYLQGYEISYQLFGDQHAGRGYTSDAVNLLVGYLFGRKRVNKDAAEHSPRQHGFQARGREVRLRLRGDYAWLLVPPRRVSRPGDLVAPAGGSRCRAGLSIPPWRANLVHACAEQPRAGHHAWMPRGHGSQRSRLPWPGWPIPRGGPGRARRAMGVNRDLPACPITAGVMIRGGGLRPAHRASYHEPCEASPQ